jgi:hypothetical protein
MALAYAWALWRLEGGGKLGVCGEAARDGWRGRLGKWSRQP